MADSGHFEFRHLAELAVTYERCIGANFSVKWFRLTNKSREKGRKRIVTEPPKMTTMWTPIVITAVNLVVSSESSLLDTTCLALFFNLGCTVQCTRQRFHLHVRQL